MRILKPLNKSIFIVASLIYSLASSAQQLPTSCDALVEVGNDLWLAIQNGKLQKQLTHDGKLKYAVAVSPNGKIIGYSGEQSGDSVTLIDANGIHLGDVKVNVEDAITSLAWTSSDTLKIGQHVSPTARKYFFMRVPVNPFSNHFSEIVPPIAADSCALSPEGKYIACFLGGSLSINNRDVYHVANPFTASEKIQSLSLSVGSMAETSTSPVFKIQIIEIKDGQIRIRVSSVPGEWQEFYQKNGDITELNELSELPLLGLQSNFTKTNATTALLTVIKSLEGGVSFEAGPVWDQSGKRIAFIEKNDAGNRALVLINKEMGNAVQAKGAVDARINLPSNFPTSALMFVSDTHLVISGKGAQLDIDIPARGKVPSTAGFQISAALPSELTIKNQSIDKSVSVKGWVCQ